MAQRWWWALPEHGAEALGWCRWAKTEQKDSLGMRGSPVARSLLRTFKNKSLCVKEAKCGAGLGRGFRTCLVRAVPTGTPRLKLAAAAAALGAISWAAGALESCFPPSCVVAGLTLLLFQHPAC